MKGLFINNKKAKDSIYESGYMAYECLLLSDKYTLDYIEIDINNRSIATGYDFYLFNYHPQTMRWLDTRVLKKKLGFVSTIVLEVLPNDPFVLCPKNDFDTYCVLDPTINIADKRVYAFPRPLEKIDFALPVIENKVPVIGTFGFATKGKGFQHVVEAVNQEFDKAIVRINIPYGDFVPNSKEYAAFLGNLCKQKAKRGIEVEVTHDFMSKEALIKWCASNTLNCFLYDRNQPGLSATTDQVIVSEKPLSVSDNETFRHITAYLKPYPQCSLKKSIEESGAVVKKIKEDWTPVNFAKSFEKLINDSLYLIENKRKQYTGILELPIISFIDDRIKKYSWKFKKIISNFSKQNDSKHSQKII